jgi:hypothetical protein
MTWKKPNIAREVKGMAIRVPLSTLVPRLSCHEGTAEGRKTASSVRATTGARERVPRRATVTTAMKTHITEASA